ncbi:hypothetical protein K1719_007493 [Acacia pycnantha]|nr:hypothetical protein K1719_007493 [Acacia pycnantha]
MRGRHARRRSTDRQLKKPTRTVRTCPTEVPKLFLREDPSSGCLGSVAAALRSGQRSIATTSKSLTGLGSIRNGKNTKASSELCKFLGIPDQSRSEIALLISKFIKLNNSWVPILTLYSFFSFFLRGQFDFIA